MSNPRLLVIRGGAIGDFILTLPAIGALREQFPAAHIEILGYPHILQLADKRYYADATRSIDARPLSGFFIPKAVLDPALMEYFGSFSVVISYLFDPDHVFADNVRRCGAKQLIEASPRPTELHAAVHYCKPLEALAIYVDNPQPRFYPNDADRAFADRFMARQPSRPIVAIHPGSGSPRKNWPAQKFADLAEWLIAESGVKVILTRGEADDAAIAKVTERLTDHAVDWLEIVAGFGLAELAAVLGRCAGYIGNDSGITHLAAATGIPTVALFGPTSPAIWEPRGNNVQLLHFAPSIEPPVGDAVARMLGRSSC